MKEKIRESSVILSPSPRLGFSWLCDLVNFFEFSFLFFFIFYFADQEFLDGANLTLKNNAPCLIRKTMFCHVNGTQSKVSRSPNADVSNIRSWLVSLCKDSFCKINLYCGHISEWKKIFHNTIYWNIFGWFTVELLCSTFLCGRWYLSMHRCRLRLLPRIE